MNRALKTWRDQAFSVFSSSSVNGTGSPTSVIALSAASCCGCGRHDMRGDEADGMAGYHSTCREAETLRPGAV